MVTIEQLKKLSHGDILHHTHFKNSTGGPMRCRVNGKLKLWKTRPDDFKLPVKHGLYDYFYVTPENADDWEIAK